MSFQNAIRQFDENITLRGGEAVLAQTIQRSLTFTPDFST